MTLAVREWRFRPLSSLEYNSSVRYKELQFGQQWDPEWGEGPPQLPLHVPSTTLPSGSLLLDEMIAATPFTGYASLIDGYAALNPGKRLDQWYFVMNPPYFVPSFPYEVPEWWACWAHQPNPSVNSVQSMHRGLEYLEVTNSSNTPGWSDTQGVRVGGLSLTKKRPPIKRPTKPVYFQPRIKRGAAPVKKAPVVLLIKPPIRFFGEGLPAFKSRLDRWAAVKSRREARLTRHNDKSFALRDAKYKLVLAANAVRISNYDKAYKTAHQKYEDRLAKYLESVRKSKDLTYSRSPINKGNIPQDNAYGRIKMTLQKPAVYSKMIGWRKWFDNRLNGEMYRDHVNDYLVHYHSAVLSSESTSSELAQYAEDVRKLIVGAINPHLEEFDNKLKRKIHQKLKNQTVHIGNIIAERKQTMDLVQSSVKRILQLIKLKKNIFKEAALYARNAKQIASDVLAFKFGVEPLMGDIQKFAKYLDESADSHIVTARANTGATNAIPLKVSTSQITFVGTVEISYTVKCVVDNPASRTLSEFGLINPLEILWEVTPWSFVVDWFFPVGDWLSNKTADCGLSFKTGTRKIKLVGKFTTNVLPQNGSSSGSPSGSVDASNVVDFVGEVIDRTVLTDMPDLPPIRLKNPLSWSHGIETVALLVQRLKIRPQLKQIGI